MKLIRKLAAFTAVWLSVALIFSGCRLGRPENNFVYDLEAKPVNLDPQSAGDTASLLVIANLFEGLVHVGDNGVPTPAAASSWTVSPDEKVYTFTLQEKGKWSDGTSVTADDFVFGFQRLLDPNTNAPAARNFYCIENAQAVHSGIKPPDTLGVKALSIQTLEIRLSQPDPTFPEKLDSAAAMPCSKKFFDETKGRYGLAENKIMGNGPFSLSSWHDNGNLSFRPNRYYQDSSHITATSILYTVPKEEREPKLDRFLNGTLSAAYFTGSDYLVVSSHGEYAFQESDSAAWGLVFNTRKEPFSSLNLRKALFQAADFSAMEKVLPEYLDRSDTVLTPGMEIDGKSYREMAGYPKISGQDLTAAVASHREALMEIDPQSLRGARVIIPKSGKHWEYFAYPSQIWQRDLGLYFKVEVLDQREYEERLASGDFECAMFCLNGSVSRPAAMLSMLESGAYACPDPDYSLLMQQASAARGQELAELCMEAEQLLLDSCTFLPFYRQSEYFVLNSGVEGVTYRFHAGIPDFRFGSVR